MYWKFGVSAVIMVLLALAETAFIRSLPGWLKYLDLSLVVLVYIYGYFGYRAALWWAGGAGLILDIYSFAPFGVYMVALPAAIVFVNFLALNFFTDRSLYTYLALTFFGAIALKAVTFPVCIAYNLGEPGGLYPGPGWHYFFVQLKSIFFDLVAAFLGFYLINLLFAGLRPVFLIKKS